jgi:hypothetical protein
MVTCKYHTGVSNNFQPNIIELLPTVLGIFTIIWFERNIKVFVPNNNKVIPSILWFVSKKTVFVYKKIVCIPR